MSMMVDFPLTNVSENHEWAERFNESRLDFGTANGETLARIEKMKKYNRLSTIDIMDLNLFLHMKLMESV